MFCRVFLAVLFSFLIVLPVSADSSVLAFSDNASKNAGIIKQENESHKPVLRSAALRPVISPIDSAPKPDLAKNKHISLVLVGDTGFAPTRQKPLAQGVWKHGIWQTFDETTIAIRHLIDGDINFANMESVVSANSKLPARDKAFNFMTHPNGVRHLSRIGFNLFSMANNHAFDYGAGGIEDSLSHMNKLKVEQGLTHAGIGRNHAEAAATPVLVKKDTKFAFGAIGIGAAGNGLSRASTKRPGQLNLYNHKDVALLTDNLAKADADYRILSLHKGAERSIKVAPEEIKRVRNSLLDQGNIDLLIGHHAHVTRGVEINNGRLIFYGLGNFLHQGTANMAGSGRCRDYSILAKVHLVRETSSTKPQLAAIEIVPIKDTHLRPKPFTAQKAARRVAILNGLASQFDSASQNAKGVRFAIRHDGSGLYCTRSAMATDITANLCKNFRAPKKHYAKIYKSAVSSCGGSFGKNTFANLRLQPDRNETFGADLKVAALPLPQEKPLEPKEPDKPETKSAQKQAKAPAKKTVKRVSTKKATKRIAKVKKPRRIAKRTSKRVTKKRTRSAKRYKTLSNRQLAKMSAKQRKRYWTRYWYIKRGRKVPKHLR